MTKLSIYPTFSAYILWWDILIYLGRYLMGGGSIKRKNPDLSIGARPSVVRPEGNRPGLTIHGLIPCGAAVRRHRKPHPPAGRTSFASKTSHYGYSYLVNALIKASIR